MQAYVNKYKGKCETCHQWVQPGKGFICRDEHGLVKQKSNTRYVATWCKAHCPAKIGVLKTEGPRRLMVKNGVGCCVTPYEPNNLDLFRSMPGARFRRVEDRNNVLGSPYWEVSLKPGDRHRLLEVADRLQLDIDEELQEIEKSKEAQVATVKGLYPFQVAGVDWLSKGDNRLLGDDMGLGKTVETLVAFPKDVRAIVVVPAAVKYNWEAECIKWRPDLKPTVINGKDNFRFPNVGEVVIINYDILPNSFKPVKPHANAKAWEEVVRISLTERELCKGAIVVFDEAQRLKNPETARYKKCKGLSMVCGKVWALTGTPLDSRPMDMWNMLSCLGMAQEVFGRFKRNQYGQKGFIELMNGRKKKFGGYEFGHPEPIVPELLRRVMLRRLRAEVLPDLPKKQYHTIKVDLPKNLQTKMDALWNEWGELIKEKELPPFEEFSEIRAALAESRIPAIMELVDDHEEQDVPLVVFSAHKAPCEALSRRDGWEMITGATSAKKRQEIVSRFQAGELKGIALTIRAGGVGLTLTRAWKAIFIDLDWVPSWNTQAEDRICRIGQLANCVEIVRMVSDHPLDLHVLDLIAWKISVIIAAVEKLMEVKKEVKNVVEAETEEQYQARLEAIAAIEGEDYEDLPWPAIVLDPAIPF